MTKQGPAQTRPSRPSTPDGQYTPPSRAEKWLSQDPDDTTRHTLHRLLQDASQGGERAQHELTDAFRGPLAFGTAGIRAPMGPGPHRMNRVTVAQAAAGLASYLNEQHDQPRVVIGYDARHNSRDFAYECASVLAGANIEALILPEALPTPVLAYTTRRLNAHAGIMVTASHNPKRDNGLKVYLGDGRQIIPPIDADIARRITAAGTYWSIPRSNEHTTLTRDTVDSYLDCVSRVPRQGTPRAVVSVHTALHGVGDATLRQAATRAGFPAPIAVAEQATPDPDFPTVTSPNPEEPGALTLAIDTARRVHADVIIANDPDADRCAVAVPVTHTTGGPSREEAVTWRVLTGDETGWLLAWWLLQRGDFHATMAASLVSSTMLSRIAAHAGVGHHTTLTGFKWISRAPDLGFGYEEAIGYCVDPTNVPDKDGISAALLALELVAYLKETGRTVLDVLDELAVLHGVHLTRQLALTLPTPEAIQATVSRLTSAPPEELAGMPVARAVDLTGDYSDLPPTEGILLELDGARVIVRPSGTEPKVRCYLEVVRPTTQATLLEDRRNANESLSQLENAMRRTLTAHDADH